MKSTKSPNYLREYLRKNQMTQKDFAEKVGISAGTLSSIISGRIGFSKEIAQSISKFTNGEVSDEELFSIKNQNAKKPKSINGLREYLDKKYISRAVFAKQLGISVQALHKITAEKGGPSEQVAQKIVELTKGEITKQDLSKIKKRKKKKRASKLLIKHPRKATGLRKYLKKKKILQSEFARRIGISIPALYNIMSGKGDPSKETAEKIEKFTNGQITREDFLKLKRDRRRGVQNASFSILSEYLEKNYMTQVDFAKKIGISRVALSGIVSGKSSPSEKTADKIMKVTGGEVNLKPFSKVNLKK